MAIEFTVDHDHTAITDVGEEQLIGWIYFTVQTRAGDFQVRYSSSGPSPKTIKLPRRKGYLAIDGHLYKDEAANEPFRLVANDPEFNLDHITYRVDFDLTDSVGNQYPVSHTYFPAPSTDTTLYLTRFMKDPEQIVMEVRTKGYAEDILDISASGVVMVTGTAAEQRSALGVNLVDLNEVTWFDDFASFPATGVADVVYGDRTDGKLYLWAATEYVAARASVTANDITDASAIGSALLLAADSAEARGVIGNLANVSANATDPAYGAVGDGATNDRAAIQAAIDYVAGAGGGVVYLPAGTYALGSALAIGDNVVLRGEGKFSTTLYALASGYQVVVNSGASPAGSYKGIEHLTLWGYGDRDSSQDLDLAMLQADYVWFDHVRAVWSRYRALVAVGNGGPTSQATFTNCTIENSLRDGIHILRMNRAVVVGNHCSKIGDDAIAVHVASDDNTAAKAVRQVTIVGNRLEKCHGIKCLGASNAVISGNTARFYSGYMIDCSYDSSALQGYKDEVSVVISDNVGLDGINPAVFGLTGRSNAISVGSPLLSAGSLGYIPHHISRGDGTNSVGYNENGQNAFHVPGGIAGAGGGVNIPRAGSRSIVVANNTITQTLTDLTVFEDAGFGSLWKSTGEAASVAMTGTIWPKTRDATNVMDGVWVWGGATYDTLITGNAFHGVRNAVYVWSSTGATVDNFVPSIDFTNNRVLRCDKAVELGAFPTGTRGEIAITNNTIDLDPMFESPLREVSSGSPTGCWTGSSPISAMVLRGPFLSGDGGVAVIERNRIRNVWQMTSGSPRALVRSNEIWVDTAVTSPSTGGVNLSTVERFANRVISYDADPRSLTYRTVRSTLTQAASAMPSTGYFVAGEYVRNTGFSATNPVEGWRRLTTGTSHVLGTDWVAAVSHSLSNTAALDFGSVAAQSFADLTITVTGAATGDAAALGVPTAAVTAGIVFSAWVSAADTVTVRAHNYTAGALDPASGMFKATIVR